MGKKRQRNETSEQMFQSVSPSLLLGFTVQVNAWRDCRLCCSMLLSCSVVCRRVDFICSRNHNLANSPKTEKDLFTLLPFPFTCMSHDRKLLPSSGLTTLFMCRSKVSLMNCNLWLTNVILCFDLGKCYQED